MSNDQTGKYSISEIDNYGNSGGKYFTLKEDKEIAKARFMANTLEDIPFYVVHEIKDGDKRKYVVCLRKYGDPIEKCPLCDSGSKNTVKFFLPMYMEDTGEVRFWERGKTFGQVLSSLAARFNPLVNTLFEVQRLGKKGDTSTTYQTFPIATEQGASIINQLPPIEEVIGNFVENKTAEEMESFLSTGTFNIPNVPTQQNSYNQQVPAQPQRRFVPTNNGNSPF